MERPPRPDTSRLHTVAERCTLVVVGYAAGEVHGGVRSAERRVSTLRCDTLVVRRVALKNIAVDRMGQASVHRRV